MLGTGGGLNSKTQELLGTNHRTLEFDHFENENKNRRKCNIDESTDYHGYHGFSLARHNVQTKGREWQENPHAAHWFNLAMEWLKSEWGE